MCKTTVFNWKHFSPCEVPFMLLYWLKCGLLTLFFMRRLATTPTNHHVLKLIFLLSQNSPIQSRGICNGTVTVSPIFKGGKQGCIFAPLLFNFSINEIVMPSVSQFQHLSIRLSPFHRWCGYPIHNSDGPLQKPTFIYNLQFYGIS